MERYSVSTPEGPLKSQQNLHNEGALLLLASRPHTLLGSLPAIWLLLLRPS